MKPLDPAPRRPLTPTERWMALVFGLGFTGLVVADLLEGYTSAKLSVGFIFLFWFPLLVLHELGHAVVAHLLGWRVVEVTIGYGQQIARFRFYHTLVVLRAIPAGGHVIPAPVERRLARAQSAFIYFSGPGVELAVVGFVWAILGWETLTSSSTGIWIITAQSLALTAFIGAIINLIPFSIANSASDGLGILLSSSFDTDHFEYLIALPFTRAAERALEWGHPDKALIHIEQGLESYPKNIPLEIMHAICVAAQGDKRAAMNQLQEIRDLPELGEFFEAEALHAASVTVLETRDESLLSEAESACRSAIKLSPAAKYKITLARIQLEQGRFAKATEILMEAYKETRDAQLEDQCLAYLAMASYQEGRTRDAVLYHATVRSRKASPLLLERIEQTRLLVKRSQELSSTQV